MAKNTYLLQVGDDNGNRFFSAMKLIEQSALTFFFSQVPCPSYLLPQTPTRREQEFNLRKTYFNFLNKNKQWLRALHQGATMVNSNLFCTFLESNTSNLSQKFPNPAKLDENYQIIT